MAERNGLATITPLTPVNDNDWTEARQKFVLENFCGGAPLPDAMAFIETAMRRKLSPEAKQIYLINRRVKNKDTGRYDDRWTPQTGIDGFRTIADRTHAYAGSDEPVFEWRGDQLFKASVTVWKLVQGQRCPFTASAYWDEYNPGQGLWSKMPRTLLAKCAESLALRKAFPEDLSGLYTDAEMDQAGVVETRATVVESPRPIQVNQTTGEIAATAERHAEPTPMSADTDLPCAIDGCSGICSAEWVAFSHRKYGHPLCSKHSAMAKKGELDGALARLNEPKPEPIIETTARLSPPAKPAEASWNEFWPWAKQHHVKNEEDFVALTNRGTKGLTPAAARDLMESALEGLARAAVAEEDGAIETPVLFSDVEFSSDASDRYTN